MQKVGALVNGGLSLIIPRLLVCVVQGTGGMMAGKTQSIRSNVYVWAKIGERLPI
ncbi:hypothetical protein D3C84_990310 [compost metagenome]